MNISVLKEQGDEEQARLMQEEIKQIVKGGKY